MFTGLSTAAGPVMHIGTIWDACLIAGFIGTSTGRGTRRRGNPGETREIKRTGPALRPGAIGRSSDRNVRQAGSRLQSSTGLRIVENRGTGSGSTDGADASLRNAEDQERDRIQPTALSGSPATALTPRSRPRRPSPTRTWRGNEEHGSARTLRPLAQFQGPSRKHARQASLARTPCPCRRRQPCVHR